MQQSSHLPYAAIHDYPVPTRLHARAPSRYIIDGIDPMTHGLPTRAEMLLVTSPKLERYEVIFQATFAFARALSSN
jgi:hypothetical protein